MSRTYATSAAVVVISILFPLLGTIAVALRFYTRKQAKLTLWIDDWLTIPALILEYALAGLLIWGAATRSLGQLLPAPDPAPGPQGYLFSTSDQQIRLQQIQYFFDFIGVFAFGFLKLSILFFYRKVFCTGARKSIFDTITACMIILVIAWTLAFGIGSIFLCGVHPQLAWAPVAIVAEKCSPQLLVLEGYAISDFIMDVMIWTIPIPKIWMLQMSVRHKVEVIAVFLVGILTIASSAARMAIYIIYIVNAFAQSDGETLITYLLFWTMIECGLGLIVVCLPTLRSIYGKLSPRSIFSGIRSALAHQSLRSSSRISPGATRLDSLDKSGKSETLVANLYNKDEGTTQTYIVGAHDLEQQYTFPRAAIQVRSEVEQH
ncbi:hypothetical protein B0J14DRAFT_238113 [Halenospora varia]|nr:hypothetical protein B0J14DRAFT_238113 [Halenospora varia]